MIHFKEIVPTYFQNPISIYYIHKPPPKRFFSAIDNLNQILFLLQIKRRCTFLSDTINILTHWLY